MALDHFQKQNDVEKIKEWEAKRTEIINKALEIEPSWATQYPGLFRLP